MSPHLSRLNVAMAHRNYLRRNNLQILKLATYTKIEDHYHLGANWQLFRFERIAKCSYFMLSTQNIKFYWFVMKIKKFLLPIWWYTRGSFPLWNTYFGVFILNGLLNCLNRSQVLSWSYQAPIPWKPRQPFVPPPPQKKRKKYSLRTILKRFWTQIDLIL